MKMNIKKKISLSVITALSLTSLSLNAQEFKPVGFKATGMGGTGVASSRGSLAGYYNPALLRFSDYTAEFSLNVGVRVRESNLIDNMDKLNKIDFQTTMDNIATGANNDGASVQDANNIKDAQQSLSAIGTNNAFTITATPTIAAQLSDALAIGVYSNVDLGFRANIDDTNLNLIFKKNISGTDYYYKYDPNNTSNGEYTSTTKADYESNSLEYGINNGNTYIAVNSMVLVETPLSYAHAFQRRQGTISVGLNLKPMMLTTSSQEVQLGESSDNADDDSALYETQYKPTIGLDLGLAYRPNSSITTFGLMAKNINSPTFEVDTVGSKVTKSEKYTIDPMVRAGVSIPVLSDNAEFAFDVDLTKNDTLIEGEKSQYVGLGLELHPASWFSFRIGGMQDVAAENFDDGTILTTGLGFGLKWAQIDLSAMVGSKTGEYDGQTIPKYAAVNLSLVSKWGDGYNKKRVNQYVPSKQIQEKTKNALTPEEQRRIKRDAQKAQNDLDKNL